jgi:RNA polymerase sigma factor (sigma-70 family)
MGPPPFQRLLDQHRHTVWRFLVASAGRDEADDCFQETFLAALRAYPRLPVGADHRAWLLTIAHRKAIDAHRAGARRPRPVAGEELADTPAPAPAPAGNPDDDLWKAVRALPHKQRTAVVLRYVGDLKHAETARVLGTTEAAARRNLHEAMTKLRKEFTR